MAGPYPYPDQFPAPQQQIPPSEDAAHPYPDTVGAAYPGMLPPPVQYPKRRRWRVVLAVLAALVVVAGAGTAVVLVTRNGGGTAGGLTETAARTEIQRYLDALADGDDETIARHALCGMFEEVKQRRSDLEVANLNSDAFRKQFNTAEVTSIDKIVRLSVNQARVLFSMEVVPTGGAPSGSAVQGIAELLYQDNQVLVCNYLIRTGGQY